MLNGGATNSERDRLRKSIREDLARARFQLYVLKSLVKEKESEIEQLEELIKRTR